MTSTSLARTALPCAFVLLLTLVSPTASAQLDAGVMDGSIPDGTVAPPPLSFTDFALSVERFDPLAGAWVKLDPTEQAFFFDRARCECAEDTRNFTGSIKIAIEPSAAAAEKIRSLLAANEVDTGSARLYAGGNVVNCLVPSSATTPDVLSAYCLNLLDPSSYAASIPGGMAGLVTEQRWESPPIPVAWLFNAARAPVCTSPQACNQTNACGSTRAAATIYFWAQTSATALPERTDLSFPINLAGQALSTPSNVTVETANEALVVKWGWPTGRDPAADASFLGVQLFCQRGQGEVFASGTYPPAFTTSALTCPDVAPVPATPLAFANLDPSYLCSGLLPTTATSYRIPGLQNDIFYGVGVAAVDKYYNLSLAEVVYQAPSGSDTAPDGGVRQVGGGGCALTGPRGPRAAWPSLGLLSLGALLLGRRRAPRPRGVGRQPKVVPRADIGR